MTHGPQTANEQVLVVDDTPANLDLLASVLEPHGYRVMAAPSGAVALSIAARARPDIILLDVMMPDLDGYETCRQLKQNELTRDIPVLFISARDETQSLVEGFAAGGVDYIVKPFHAEEVLSRVRTHLSLSRLARELSQRNRDLEHRTSELSAANQKLRHEIDRRERSEDALQTAGEQLSALSRREAEHWGLEAFIGRSRTISHILQDIRRLQNFATVNVLINGESGTGKELVARALHYGSSREKGPFIPLNCVAIPENLGESTLFGHTRGSFTGATMDRKGYFELAHGGTLFLDEIGDMPASLQAKLLRVLEDGRITPVGASREKQVDVRVVAATNADLEARIASGAFREDLYFRLAQFTVFVPPLRERREDIALLAEHFLNVFAAEMGMRAPALSRDAIAALQAYPFPGNVRELKNLIERSLIESGGGEIRASHLKTGLGRTPAIPLPPGPAQAPTAGAKAALIEQLPLNLEEAEDLLIKRALAETRGNVAEAARRLGINRTRIYRKMGANTDA